MSLKKNAEPEDSLSEAQDSGCILDIKVFPPFVDWERANSSKSWYKDVDWSAIPFNRLSDDEKESLDWSKINYAEAIDSDTFKYDLIDWSDISAASTKIKKKVYRSINWGDFDFKIVPWQQFQHIDWSLVDFEQVQDSGSLELTFDQWWHINNELDPSDKKRVYANIDWSKVNYGDLQEKGFDWTHVNIKEALAAPGFSLDYIDGICGNNESKNFKKLSRELKKNPFNALIKSANTATLMNIGYENFSSKINDSLIKEFSVESHRYALVMKPYNHEHASLVAKGMDGKLATVSDNKKELFDELSNVVEEKSLQKKLLKSGKDDRKWNIWVDGTFDSNDRDYALSIQKDNYRWEEDPMFLMSDEDERPLTLSHIPQDEKHFFLVDMIPIDPIELVKPGEPIPLLC